MHQRRLILALLSTCGSVALSTGCGSSPRLVPTSGCDLQKAAELLEVNIQNGGAGDLNNYPAAITLDQNNFDFTLAAVDGGDLAVWQADQHTSLPFWIESYDASAGKALLWIRMSKLAQQGSLQAWVTAGPIPNCAAQTASGYEVFPFFSDVSDFQNWQLTSGMTISNTVTTGPLVIEDQNVIESDGSYNNTPGLAAAANGDWVLSYRKGPGHSNAPIVVLRRSQDQGATRSPEVPYFDTSKPDPGLFRTPLGDLLLELIEQDTSGNSGAAYTRSTDNGLTWSAFTFFDSPPENTSAFANIFPIIGAGIFGISYGPSTFTSGSSPFLWTSDDDGLTWIKRSEIRSPGDPGLNESALVQTSANNFLEISRSDDSVTTYGKVSTDLGSSWGSPVAYTTQVGVLDAPLLIQVGPALLLLGREALQIPNSSNGSPRQFVAFVSYDAGQTFQYGTVLNTYTGLSIDGGYSCAILMSDGRLFVVYYADSHNLRLPDIKSLVLRVTSPQISPAKSLHLRSNFSASQAIHALSFDLSRYSLDFRFQSNDIPAGSQFSMTLQDSASGASRNLVQLELPSTHALDPTLVSGFISNGNFVPLLTTFAYSQNYRVRTIIDEVAGTQQGEILDSFGSMITSSDPQPFVDGIAFHPSTLAAGNNSDFRATDTLLDFVFIKPAADPEPTVSVQRIH